LIMERQPGDPNIKLERCKLKNSAMSQDDPKHEKMKFSLPLIKVVYTGSTWSAFLLDRLLGTYKIYVGLVAR